MKSPGTQIVDPIFPTKEEVILARECRKILASQVQPGEKLLFEFLGRNGKSLEIKLPAPAVRIMIEALEQIAQGNAASLVPLQAELSTTQAADLLNVSRPFVVKLLEEQAIPYRKVGAHRRVNAADVLRYKEKMLVKRREALDQLAEEAQDMNLGYE